eukprot:335583-Rhodomonas_salina.1
MEAVSNFVLRDRKKQAPSSFYSQHSRTTKLRSVTRVTAKPRESSPERGRSAGVVHWYKLVPGYHRPALWHRADCPAPLEHAPPHHIRGATTFRKLFFYAVTKPDLSIRITFTGNHSQHMCPHQPKNASADLQQQAQAWLAI